uniref:Uncharacterized protein n=1 Tax=Arundo donax TaxID=35708 RepID=A0A0A9E8I7_ARUDO
MPDDHMFAQYICFDEQMFNAFASSLLSSLPLSVLAEPNPILRSPCKNETF